MEKNLNRTSEDFAPLISCIKKKEKSHSEYNRDRIGVCVLKAQNMYKKQ